MYKYVAKDAEWPVVFISAGVFGIPCSLYISCAVTYVDLCTFIVFGVSSKIFPRFVDIFTVSSSDTLAFTFVPAIADEFLYVA